jgi:hypothetical protein
MKTSIAYALLVVVLGIAATGCEGVKAYQRGKLAHPTMSMEEPMSAAESHVYGIQEGAVGGVGGAGGGCGCN